MKSKKIMAALCALAVVVSSSGGLPFSGLRLFDTAVTASAADFEGDGSATSPYLIASAADWNALADAVNSGESYSGKYFKLTEDISVSTMIGKNNHGGGSHIPFSGTFDGDGHVLTVNINSTSTHGAAPFCGVQNAVIKNLKVEGSVVGGIHSSGLVGTTGSNDSGTLTIENVVVNVDVSGNTHLGGVVGHGFGTNITLKNVSYGGKIAGTSFSGGLVGWCGPNAKLTAENCSFSGTYSGGFHPIGFAYSSGNAQVTNFYTTKTATNTTQNQYTYTGGLTQNTVSITAPTSKTNLTSSGDDVELINAGSTNVGTMKYSLDGRNYSEEIPKAAAGEHSVWYRVEVNDNYISEKRIKVNVVHAHAFTYSADGNTITAECNSDCEITDGLTLTISAPTDLKADGSPKEATLSTGYNTTAFPDTYTIEYYKGEEKLDGAPSAGGHYTAKVTVGEATASVDFTIVVDPAYTITIPAAVNLKSSDPVNITAEGVELNEGQKIIVTLDSATYTKSGSEFSAKDKSGESVVSYSIKAGDTDVSVGGTVAEFESKEGEQSVPLSFTADLKDVKFAGTHTETLTFGIAVENAAPANPYAANVVGDVVTFGSYDWYIIGTSDDGVTLLMKDNLMNKAYNDSYTNVTWETSSLRTYLNEDFYNRFSADDKAKIALTHNTNPNNPDYNTSGGNETDDYIYLLSIAEANALDDINSSIRANGSWWWLRSPGYASDGAAFVIEDGYVYTVGRDVDYEDGVRPALNLKF